MLTLLLFKAQGPKDLCKLSKPYHIRIHWIALAENSQMSTLVPGFQTLFRFFCVGQIRHQQHIRPKKKLFVSCNPTLTSFYSKNPYPKVFSALPTPNQHQTCIKHKFLTKEIMQKKIFFTNQPTLIFFRPLQETDYILFLA